MPSICVKDVDQQEFVKAFSVFLKNSGKVKVPEWADIVKTATHKELAPYDPDWYVVIIFWYFLSSTTTDFIQFWDTYSLLIPKVGKQIRS